MAFFLNRTPVNQCFCGHYAPEHTATTCLQCLKVNPADAHVFSASPVVANSPKNLSSNP